MQSKVDKASYWRRKIEEFKASGLSRAAFCRKHHIRAHNLYYWLNRQPSNDAAPRRFLAVAVDEARTVEAKSLPSIGVEMRITFPDGVTIDCPSGSDFAAVGVLVEFLRRSSP